jgi:hypothetical protein
LTKILKCSRARDVNKDAANRPAEGHTVYSYDGGNQLTSATGAIWGSYAYDLNGNRTWATAVPHGNRLASDNTYDYTYDAEGNLVKRIETTNAPNNREYDLSYDNRNRLTRIAESFVGNVANSFVRLDYFYNAFDRLVERKETDYQYGDGGEGSSGVTSSGVVAFSSRSPDVVARAPDSVQRP